jgi:hypothetical protein
MFAAKPVSRPLRVVARKPSAKEGDRAPREYKSDRDVILAARERLGYEERTDYKTPFENLADRLRNVQIVQQRSGQGVAGVSLNKLTPGLSQRQTIRSVPFAKLVKLAKAGKLNRDVTVPARPLYTGFERSSLKKPNKKKVSGRYEERGLANDLGVYDVVISTKKNADGVMMIKDSLDVSTLIPAAYSQIAAIMDAIFSPEPVDVPLWYHSVALPVLVPTPTASVHAEMPRVLINPYSEKGAELVRLGLKVAPQLYPLGKRVLVRNSKGEEKMRTPIPALLSRDDTNQFRQIKQKKTVKQETQTRTRVPKDISVNRGVALGGAAWARGARIAIAAAKRAGDEPSAHPYMAASMSLGGVPVTTTKKITNILKALSRTVLTPTLHRKSVGALAIAAKLAEHDEGDFSSFLTADDRRGLVATKGLPFGAGGDAIFGYDVSDPYKFASAASISGAKNQGLGQRIQPRVRKSTVKGVPVFKVDTVAAADRAYHINPSSLDSRRTKMELQSGRRELFDALTAATKKRLAKNPARYYGVPGEDSSSMASDDDKLYS